MSNAQCQSHRAISPAEQRLLQEGRSHIIRLNYYWRERRDHLRYETLSKGKVCTKNSEKPDMLRNPYQIPILACTQYHAYIRLGMVHSTLYNLKTAGCWNTNLKHFNDVWKNKRQSPPIKDARNHTIRLDKLSKSARTYLG